MTRNTIPSIERWLTRRGYGDRDLAGQPVTVAGAEEIAALLDAVSPNAHRRHYRTADEIGVPVREASDRNRLTAAERFVLAVDGSRVAEIETEAAVLPLTSILNDDTDWLGGLGPEALLLDDAVLIYRPWSAPEAWRLTAAAEDVDASRRAFGLLARLRDDASKPAPSGLAAAAAPLADMAAFAFDTAPGSCARDDAGACLCDWYHGLWPYLRLFGMAATPERHAAFFHGAFTEAASSGGFDRILVCGTADYAMPAFVHDVYRRNGRSPDVTVLDLCPTPLALSERFASHAGISWTTVARDALAPYDDDSFDLICSHSFLSRFDAHTRPKLLARWHDALRPGGRIVTTTRLNPDWSPDDVGLSPVQIDSLVDQVSQRVARWRRVLSIDDEAIIALARRYAASLFSYSVRSAEELETLFSDAGLRIVRLDLKDLAGGGRKAMPGLVKTARYADIVAERPDR